MSHPTEARADAIYARSIAIAESGFPDYVEDGDGGMWIGGTRGSAAAFYAAEYGIPFVKVRVRRAHLRIDRQAIRDTAHYLAREAWSTADEIAYTYEDEGWMWESCKPGEGYALWYCEAKP